MVGHLRNAALNSGLSGIDRSICLFLGASETMLNYVFQVSDFSRKINDFLKIFLRK